MTINEIEEISYDFARVVKLVQEAGFDAVEIHAGHGYLISQFLSPYTSKRKDLYGGSFENRSRFLRDVIVKVLDAAGGSMAVVVKMNLRDGFKGGMEPLESELVARLLEREGVHGLVLSNGFVSRAPMYVMRRAMPVSVMAQGIENPWMRWGGTRLFGNLLIRPEPFSEAYFLEDARKVRAAVTLPLIFVGGMKSKEKMEEVLSEGFEFIQIARALIHDPGFVNRLKPC